MEKVLSAIPKRVPEEEPSGHGKEWALKAKLNATPSQQNLHMITYGSQSDKHKKTGTYERIRKDTNGDQTVRDKNGRKRKKWGMKIRWLAGAFCGCSCNTSLA